MFFYYDNLCAFVDVYFSICRDWVAVKPSLQAMLASNDKLPFWRMISAPCSLVPLIDLVAGEA